jgi:hypothetical protein
MRMLFHEANRHFIIPCFYFLISFASKALRHKEPRRFFYFRIDNFPFRVIEGAATSLFLLYYYLVLLPQKL